MSLKTFAKYIAPIFRCYFQKRAWPFSWKAIFCEVNDMKLFEWYCFPRLHLSLSSRSCTVKCFIKFSCSLCRNPWRDSWGERFQWIIQCIIFIQSWFFNEDYFSFKYIFIFKISECPVLYCCTKSVLYCTVSCII